MINFRGNFFNTPVVNVQFSVIALQSGRPKPITYANSVDPDETARYEPSHQDLHYLPFCFRF